MEFEYVFAPGLETKMKNKAFINAVHIISIHGWKLINSSSKISENFSNIAELSIRALLDKNNMRGTKIKTISLSGCQEFFSDNKKNKQTIKHRVRGCLEELHQKNQTEEIRKSDMVLFIGHSQGAVVSVILISKLIQEGILDPNLGVQVVGLLSMAGIHHGTHDPFASYGRKPTMELQAMQTPSSHIFRDIYIPAITRILNVGVVVILVASYNDRVVNLCSSLMDGIDHPNIYRACFAHEKYLKKQSNIKLNNNNNNNNNNNINNTLSSPYQHDALLAFWMIIIQMRNEGIFEDVARLCETAPLSEKVSKAIGEIKDVTVESFSDMNLSISDIPTSFLGAVATTGLFAITLGAKVISDRSRIEHTSITIRDSGSHSLIHAEPELTMTTFRFAFSLLLGEAEKDRMFGQPQEPKMRENFNVPPVNQMEYFNVAKVLNYILYDNNNQFCSSQLQTAVKDYLKSLHLMTPTINEMGEHLKQQINSVLGLFAADFA